MSFYDKMKDVLDKGVEASKSAFGKAGDAVQDLSEKVRIEFELHKLEGRLEKEYKDLGKLVYENLVDGEFNSKNQDGFSDVIKNMEELKKDIETKKKELEKASE